MMNWILLVMGGIVAVVLAMLLGGAMAPRTRTATRTLRTSRRADEVFAYLRQADGPPRWCADLPAMRVREAEPPHRLDLTLLDDDGQPIGEWQVSVREEEGGTVATIAETVRVDNLLLRFLASLGSDGARPQRFLDAAAAQLGLDVESPGGVRR